MSEPIDQATTGQRIESAHHCGAEQSRRALISDLLIAVSGPRELVSPTFDLLTGIRGAPDLHVRLAHGPVPTPPGGTFRFCHGVVECFERADDFVLYGADGVVNVARDGRHVEGRVDGDASLHHRDVFARSTVVIALALAMHLRGRFHLHGAGLELGGRFGLALGESGCGKSTLSTAAMTQGHRILTDDLLFVHSEEGVPRAHGVPRHFHLDEQTLALSKALEVDRALVNDKRARLAVRPVRGAVFEGGVTPEWLAFPEIADAAVTRALPIAQSEAFGRLLQASAMAAADLPETRAHLAVLSQLAALPAFHLLLGRDLLDAPELALSRVTEGIAQG